MTIHSYLALRAPPTRIEAAPWSSPRTIPARGYLRLFRLGLTCLCFPTNQGIPARVVSRGDSCRPASFSTSLIFLQIRRKGELTSGLEPLTCSLRVCGQWLMSVAQACKLRIGKGVSVPCVAHHCRVLRPG